MGKKIKEYFIRLKNILCMNKKALEDIESKEVKKAKRTFRVTRRILMVIVAIVLSYFIIYVKIDRTYDKFKRK